MRNLIEWRLQLKEKRDNMRYPVGSGTKQDFEANWKIDTGFGAPTNYGFHEGVDINLKTGGDTDLGQNLMGIAPGKVVYYHYNSHPTVNFGRHLVYKITGPWGNRWVHYAHCLDQGFTNTVADVAEGQVIARLGKSGNAALAHLHMAIFKVDPIGVGIDNIASTQQELNDVYEDPIKFITQWMDAMTPIDYKALYEAEQAKVINRDAQILLLQGQVTSTENAFNDLHNKIGNFKKDLKNYIDAYQI